MSVAELEFLSKYEVDPIFEGAIRGLAVEKPANIGKWMIAYLKGEKKEAASSTGGSVNWLMQGGVSEALEKVVAEMVAQRPADPKKWLLEYYAKCESCDQKCDGPIPDIEDMKEPKIFCRGPIPTPVEKGKTYYYCMCGYSTNQPFCDGTHRDINKRNGTDFKPKAFEATFTGEENFCGCRRSEDPVICDFSHLDLPDDLGGREPVVSSFKNYEVVTHQEYSHDTVLVTLRSEDGKGVPLDPSYHFSLKLGGKSRPYTPVAYDPSTGEVTFLIKVIPGGVVSPKVKELKVGDTVELKGPSPGEYFCEGKHSVVVLLGGGSGLTPLLQVMQDAVREKRKIELYLLYSNKTAKDMLWKDEMQKMQDADPGVIKSVTHHITREKGDNGGNVHYGRLSGDVIKSVIPPVGEGHHVLLCGTPEFNKAMDRVCKDIGFGPKQITIC